MGFTREKLDGVTVAPYPPPPWRLFGRAVLVPALVRAPAPGGRPAVLRMPGGRTVGGLLLAAYGPDSTLAYRELLGVGGVVWAGSMPAAWITHGHVDDAASIAGGRGIWGIAKEPATFRWEDTAGGEGVTVSLADREIVSLRVSARSRSALLPVAAPFVGLDGTRPAWVRGRLHGTPVTARVHLPSDSPLAPLAPVFARTAVVGEVALRVGAPRVRRSR